MNPTDAGDLSEKVVSEAGDDLEKPETAAQQRESKAEEAVPASPAKTSRQVSVSLRSAIIAAVISVLAIAVGVFGWLYMSAQSKLDAQAREASNRTHAEEMAIDYLVKGTSPELKEKLTKAADSMEQVLAPLQWKSTARPLAAKVRSSAGGLYTVDSFVSVLTKTLQAPEGLQSTATYSVTLDSRNNWQITDVGGIDSALGK